MNTTPPENSPLPWKKHGCNAIADGTGEIIAVFGDYGDESKKAVANADLALRAVNNEARLVEALRTLLPMAQRAFNGGACQNFGELESARAILAEYPNGGTK